ncbi:MAG TPA: hypothetical protein VFQ78_02435 [Candidatus Udaeobacter sp.]|nr:hypothetical protein [Candidatus Udaeobacter sp.]
MKSFTATLIAIIGFSLGAVPLALGDDASFVGKWKLNPDKSQFNGLPYKIEDAGNGQYRFSFGDDVETLTLDGKGHVTKYGDTWSIKATGPNSWESTNKRDGKVTAKSKWTVSEDGKTFTTMDENMRPDGSTGQVESTFERTDGTTGLVGMWESKSVKIMSPLTVEIAKWEGDGYSLNNPAYKYHLHFKLDGKDNTPTGPRVAKGTTVSANKTDDHIELTFKLKGKTIETDRWELSADGKTLTSTVTYAGVTKPEVDVYDRQ